MADRAGRRVSAAGFTLLEVLVVITILSLIVLALTSGLNFAGRAWDTQGRQMAKEGDLSAVQTVLSGLIASGRDFNGDEGALKFIGRMPHSLARGGLYDMQLLAEEDRLVLTWRPHFSGPSKGVDTTETELFKGVAALDFAYYVKQQDGSGKWQFVADDKSQPPTLVKISLSTATGGVWPPLIVVPMIASSAGGQH